MSHGQFNIDAKMSRLKQQPLHHLVRKINTYGSMLWNSLAAGQRLVQKTEIHVILKISRAEMKQAIHHVYATSSNHMSVLTAHDSVYHGVMLEQLAHALVRKLITVHGLSLLAMPTRAEMCIKVSHRECQHHLQSVAEQSTTISVIATEMATCQCHKTAFRAQHVTNNAHQTALIGGRP